MDGTWKDKLIVAAIDFGTTSSGFVLSFLGDYRKDKATNLIAKTWKSGDQAGTYKTPTCLLLKPGNTLNPDPTFHSFGYEAERKYAQLADKKKHKEWRFFRRFKMSLYKPNDWSMHGISLRSKVKDVEGRDFDAMTVFTLSINFMKTTIIELINERCPGLREDDIYYVLTIPAIWSDQAKLFMRKAALNARIPTERLRIALEPECAALYVQAKQLAALDQMNTDERILTPGTCHVVADMGGGTIDIAAHRVNDECNFEEIVPPCGGAWGADVINMEFEQFLIKTSGAPAFSKFREENMDDYLDIQREIEHKKCAFKDNDAAAGGGDDDDDDDDDDDSEITLRIPVTFHEVHRDCNRENLSDSIRQMTVSNDVKLFKDKMKFKTKMFRGFFTNTIKGVLTTLKEMFASINDEVNTLICVGGFSDCQLLKDNIRENFKNVKIIIPEEASTSIMKGAIIYGRDQSVVNKRISRYTYGLDWNEDFDPTKHSITKREETDDGFVCRDIFKTLIVKGDQILYNKPTGEIDAYCKSKYQTVIDFPFYRSEIFENPTYIDDLGCHLIGTMSVDIGESKSLERSVKLRIFFGETELRAEAEDDGGKQYKVKFKLDEIE